MVGGLCETIVTFFLTIIPVKSYERAFDCFMQAVFYWPVRPEMGKSLAWNIFSIHIRENECLLSNWINQLIPCSISMLQAKSCFKDVRDRGTAATIVCIDV